MRTEYKEELDWMKLLHRTKKVKKFINHLTANDYNRLPLSIKQAIEFIYDYTGEAKEEIKCSACSGSGWYDRTDKKGNSIRCSSCNGTGLEEKE